MMQNSGKWASEKKKERKGNGKEKTLLKIHVREIERKLYEEKKKTIS